ncbi:molybdate ABC transporter substrate-binding protein [Candidatus Pyrohabitans sp.]
MKDKMGDAHTEQVPGRLVLLGMLVLLATGCTSGGEPGLVVFAAASLTEAFQELAREFEAQHSTEVELNFAGSNTLRIQIEQGASADVFASANEEHMRALLDRGYVDESIAFAKNMLVIVVPESNPASIESIEDLRGDVKLVIADVAVPAGKYTREALLNLEGRYGAGFAEQVLSCVVSQEDSVKGVLSKVAMGEADAGFVYATDALAAEGRVKVILLPEEAAVEPKYYAGVLSRSSNKHAAQEFIAFLLSPRGKEILRKHGFEVEP